MLSIAYLRDYVYQSCSLTWSWLPVERNISNWRPKNQRTGFETTFEFSLAVIYLTKHNFFHTVGDMTESNSIHFHIVHTQFYNGRG